jgi:hypothetical protein
MTLAPAFAGSIESPGDDERKRRPGSGAPPPLKMESSIAISRCCPTPRNSLRFALSPGVLGRDPRAYRLGRGPASGERVRALVPAAGRPPRGGRPASGIRDPRTSSRAVLAASRPPPPSLGARRANPPGRRARHQDRPRRGSPTAATIGLRTPRPCGVMALPRRHLPEITGARRRRCRLSLTSRSRCSIRMAAGCRW